MKLREALVLVFAFGVLCIGIPIVKAADWTNSLTKQMASNQSGLIGLNPDGTAMIMSPPGTLQTYYQEATPVAAVAEFDQTATTTSGVATFYLTSNKLSGGTARCTTIYPNSIRPWVNDSVNYHTTGASVVDNKTVTVTVKRSAALSNLTVLGVGLPVLLGGPDSPPDGTTVNLNVKCAP